MCMCNCIKVPKYLVKKPAIMQSIGGQILKILTHNEPLFPALHSILIPWLRISAPKLAHGTYLHSIAQLGSAASLLEL